MPVTAALLACVGSSHIHEIQWYEARTPYFTLWSSLDAEQTLALATDLSLFHAFFEASTTEVRTEPVIPTYIYAFDSTLLARQFLGSREMVSAFHSGMRDNRIVLKRMAASGKILELQRYQYARSLLRNDRSPYPLWYERGLAELLSTAELRGDQLRIGRPSKSTRKQIRHAAFEKQWVSVESLLERRDFAHATTDVHLLHAGYWLLVHYLHIGRSEGSDAERDVARYLELWRAGEPSEVALQRAFGMTASELDSAVRAYAKTNPFPERTLDGVEIEVPIEPDVRSMHTAEIARALGWLSLKTESFSRASAYFEEAVSIDPNDAHARGGVAVVLDYQDRFAKAAPLWQAVFVENPENALLHLEYARHWDDRASEADDPAEITALLTKAREHYLRSRALDASRPETHALYGATFLHAGENPWRGFDSIVRAHEMLGSNPEFNLFLACAYAQGGRMQEARRAAWIPREWIRYWRRKDIDRILRQYPSGCQSHWQDLLFAER